MGFINPCHRGRAYGDGYIQGEGSIGQLVKVVGDDLFAVNTDSTARSFGILIKTYKSGEMPGIYTEGGVYETDVYEGNIVAGDLLKVSASGKITAGVTAGDLVIGQALTAKSGTIKFQLHL